MDGKFATAIVIDNHNIYSKRARLNSVWQFTAKL